MDVQPVARVAAAPSGAEATTNAGTSKTTFAERFAAAEKAARKGERLEKVTGHAFARIKGGERDDMYVNLSGNGRNGEAFDLVRRHGRTFHIYGSGKDRVVIGLPVKDATAAPKADAAPKTDDAASKAGKADKATGGASPTG